MRHLTIPTTWIWLIVAVGLFGVAGCTSGPSAASSDLATGIAPLPSHLATPGLVEPPPPNYYPQFTDSSSTQLTDRRSSSISRRCSFG